MKNETAEIDIVERLRGLPIVGTENGRTGISTMGGALLCEAANEIERLREVVMLLVAYDEHDEDIQKGAVMWEVLIEAAHAALKEKE